MVAPVVSTSSTMRTGRVSWPRAGPALAQNPPLTFSSLCAAPAAACRAAPAPRHKMSRSSPAPASSRTRARSCAWLKPRSRSLARDSGTGTRIGRAPRPVADANRFATLPAEETMARPMVDASARRRRYFRARTAAAAAPVNSNGASVATTGPGQSSQIPQRAVGADRSYAPPSGLPTPPVGSAHRGQRGSASSGKLPRHREQRGGEPAFTPRWQETHGGGAS